MLPDFSKVFGGGGDKPLTYCAECAKNFVIPIMDECFEHPPGPRNSPGGWHMVLYCVNCGHEREADVTQDEAARYDDFLDRYERELRHSAREFTSAAMQAEIEIFVAACEADQIWPEDFNA